MVKVVFSDIAGTIIEDNPWVGIRQHPQYNQMQGKAQMRRFIVIYLLNKIKLVSDATFRDQWLKHMARAFKGEPKTKITSIYADIVENQTIYRDDVIERLQGHQQDGAKIVLVSGMFVEMGAMFAERFGFDGVIGSHMAYDTNDIATGGVTGETCVGERKVQFMKQYLRDNLPNVTLADCYGYADSYSDRSLLSSVGHGVATYPDDRLRQIAATNQWDILPA